MGVCEISMMTDWCVPTVDRMRIRIRRVVVVSDMCWIARGGRRQIARLQVSKLKEILDILLSGLRRDMTFFWILETALRHWRPYRYRCVF